MQQMAKATAGVLLLLSFATNIPAVPSDSPDATPVETFLTGTPAIRHSLAKLNVLGSVLMIAAHPDDENNPVLTYLSRGLKVRTGYLSLNRGEGGQNLLGDEQGALMGVVRTQELLAARRDDGGSQYFTRAIDFGFTTSLGETLKNWGHDKILADVVWVIRRQQPDVIMLVFSGTPTDGHGNHQASAILGKEAFEAAGDPTRFPEQLKWVKPWHARRLMRPRFIPPPGLVLPPGTLEALNGPANSPVITFDAGEFNPVIGRGYQEIALISRSEHRSQGQGSRLAYGSAPGVIALLAGDVPQKSIFDGIDITWNRVPGGARVGAILAKAESGFNDLHPERTVSALLEARPLVAALARAGEVWAQWKLDDIDQAIALCAGLRTEVQADAPAYVPGATAKLQITALNRSSLPILLNGIHLAGWVDIDVPVKNKALENNKPETTEVPVTIAANQPWSQPFWLREPRETKDGFDYSISSQQLIGRADTIPELLARFDFSLNGATFSLTTPIHFRYSEAAHGEIIRPVVVQPPVSIDLPAENFVFPLGAARDVSFQVRALAAAQSGEVRLETPQGWKVQPASVAFQLKEMGEAQEARFHLTPPAEPLTGTFRVIAKANGVEVASHVALISYSHIPVQTVLQASEGKLSAASLKVLAKRVGYVMGASDKEPEALRQMGCQVDLLTEKDLSTANLSVYDAIVTGVRAYALRADLRASQPKLMDYVKNGGTLVVQYNNPSDKRMSLSVADALDHMGPYPFSFSGDDARVTDETAPMKVLVPASPLLNFPNKITPADFDGWVQERGLYFSNKWDPRYETPLETHDAGKPELRGSTLYTRYGKGAYVFTALSWFRELPAGVPGAYRMFANLLSAGKAK